MDAETWIWLLLPMLAGIVTAVYMAQRDHHQRDDHETRIRALEQLAAHNEGAGSVSGPEGPDLSDFLKLAADVSKNTGNITLNKQATEVLIERLDTLEAE